MAGGQCPSAILKYGDEEMKKKRRSGFIIACTAPAIILFIIFMIVPTIDVFRMSLYKWGGYTAEKTFVGLENFQKLAKNPKFFQAYLTAVDCDRDVGHVCLSADLCGNFVAGEDQRTEFFPRGILYPEYSFRCGNQCNFFGHL